MDNIIKVGTRGSKLAIKQTELVLEELRKIYPDKKFEVKKIKTTGDRDMSIALGDKSLKSLFVKEIDVALLNGDIDIAVHSTKDIPRKMHKNLRIAAYLKREDPRDVLISGGKTLQELDSGAVIGTSSVRRKYQLEDMRADIKVKPIRGNIHTRISKVESGEVDAVVLALAGIKRAGLEEKVDQIFSYDEIVPAPAQGVIAVQCRKDDIETYEMAGILNDHPTQIAVSVEKHFSRIFDMGCKEPIGALALLDKRCIIDFRGMYYEDGVLAKCQVIGDIDCNTIIPERAAQKIRRQIDEKR